MTCAQAGSNPWGMVWLFQNFEKASSGGSMEVLSDHPTDDHRIATLKNEFAQNPALFGRFSSDIATATPLHGRSTYAQQSGTHRAAPAAYRPANHYCCSPGSNAQSSAASRPAPAPQAPQSNTDSNSNIQNGTIYGQ